MTDDMNKQDNSAAPSEPVAESEEAKKLREVLQDAEKKRDEYLAGWQRAKADFVNYKRDEALRFEEISKYGTGELVRELVNVLDSFDLGLRAMESKGPVERGIYMIRSQVEDILKRWGLQRIAVEEGKPFDPATQEAIAEVESGEPPGTVIEEIEPGYQLYDKIVRPARVKIAKSKT